MVNIIYVRNDPLICLEFRFKPCCGSQELVSTFNFNFIIIIVLVWYSKLITTIKDIGLLIRRTLTFRMT